jgi:hypothetical protein
LGKINWGRVILCGIIAGLAWTLLSTVNTTFLGSDFVSAVPGGRLLAPKLNLVAFLTSINILMGIWVMWIYAAIRPRFGAGPKTAAIAGTSWWIIATLNDSTWGSLGFIAAKALYVLILASLPALVIATLIGAWFYKE